MLAVTKSTPGLGGLGFRVTKVHIYVHVAAHLK